MERAGAFGKGEKILHRLSVCRPNLGELGDGHEGSQPGNADWGHPGVDEPGLDEVLWFIRQEAQSGRGIHLVIAPVRPNLGQ